jgi:hypothetical protein
MYLCDVTRQRWPWGLLLLLWLLLLLLVLLELLLLQWELLQTLLLLLQRLRHCRGCWDTGISTFVPHTSMDFI